MDGHFSAGERDSELSTANEKRETEDAASGSRIFTSTEEGLELNDRDQQGMFITSTNALEQKHDD